MNKTLFSLIISLCLLQLLIISCYSQDGISIEDAAKSYPAPPDDVNVFYFEDKKVKIQWRLSGNHIVYHLHRWCGIGSPTRDYIFSLIGSSGSNFFVDTSPPSDNCYYTVTSFNIWGNESYKSRIIKPNQKNEREGKHE